MQHVVLPSLSWHVITILEALAVLWDGSSTEVVLTAVVDMCACFVEFGDVIVKSPGSNG